MSFVETAVRWSFLSGIAEFIGLGVGERYENVDNDLGKKSSKHLFFEDDEQVTLLTVPRPARIF